jgi:redox-sensitive bicupin YhaK (pirin superfamily)
MGVDRTIEAVFPSKPTLEGAGVHLKRGVGFGDVPRFDPFLLLDDFHSAHPNDYTAGFPWHPHRGIETVTYMLRGVVEHGDSMGNRGTIYSGDVQWMTAGSGIIHQEMPKAFEGDMRGFQLWVNLPRAHKMMAPRYRGLESHKIPTAHLDDGTAVLVISGEYRGVQGPLRDIVRAPEYFHVKLPGGGVFTHTLPAGHTAFAYTVSGVVSIGDESVAADNVVLLTRGERIAVTTETGGEFLLFTGEPLNEPVAWRGPIVMNTEEELDVAFRQYSEGTFIRK